MGHRDEGALSRRQALAALAGGAAGALAGVGCRPAAAPAGPLPESAFEAGAAAPAVAPATEPEPAFVTLEVEGSAREMGRALGRGAGQLIHAALGAEPGYAGCLEAARGPLRGLVEGFLAASRERFPSLVEELEGMAEGAEIPFEDLFAWNCRSEIGAAESPCPPGCSTVGLCEPDRGVAILGHNEDGGEAYLDRMVALRALPASGVGFAVLVYPGTIPGNGPGLNAAGVVQTTNYIGPCTVSRGVPRYLVGRAVLEARSLDEAVAIASGGERAFPWHHNLGSLPAARMVSLETWPGRTSLAEVRGTLLHTNHLLHEDMLDLPERRDYLDRSSLPRLESLRRSVAERPLRARADLVAALVDHRGRPCRVCRHRGDEVPGVTVAMAAYEAPAVEMTVTVGPPCAGRSQVLRPPAASGT